jgi:hypothetical protein
MYARSLAPTNRPQIAQTAHACGVPACAVPRVSPQPANKHEVAEPPSYAQPLTPLDPNHVLFPSRNSSTNGHSATPSHSEPSLPGWSELSRQFSGVSAVSRVPSAPVAGLSRVPSGPVAALSRLPSASECALVSRIPSGPVTALSRIPSGPGTGSLHHPPRSEQLSVRELFNLTHLNSPAVSSPLSRVGFAPIAAANVCPVTAANLAAHNRGCSGGAAAPGRGSGSGCGLMGAGRARVGHAGGRQGAAPSGEFRPPAVYHQDGV